MNALATGAGWLLGCPAPSPGPWPWCCSSPTHRLFLRDQPRRQQSWFPGLRSQAKGRPQDHPEATAGCRGPAGGRGEGARRRFQEGTRDGRTLRVCPGTQRRPALSRAWSRRPLSLFPGSGSCPRRWAGGGLVRSRCWIGWWWEPAHSGIGVGRWGTRGPRGHVPPSLDSAAGAGAEPGRARLRQRLRQVPASQPVPPPPTARLPRGDRLPRPGRVLGSSKLPAPPAPNAPAPGPPGARAPHR